MSRVFAVYKQYIRISFSSALAYRANFILTLVISAAGQMIAPLLTVMIYANGVSFPGWSFREAMLIQSVFLLCTGVCAPLFSNMVWITMFHIREGSYDLLMLKPGSTVFVTVASAFELENIGTLLGGLGLFVYSLNHLPTPGFPHLSRHIFSRRLRAQRANHRPGRRDGVCLCVPVGKRTVERRLQQSAVQCHVVGVDVIFTISANHTARNNSVRI